MTYQSSNAKMPVEVTLSSELIERARSLGINISAAAEEGLLKVVNQADRRNAEAKAEAAMKEWNEYTRRHGSVADEFGEIR